MNHIVVLIRGGVNFTGFWYTTIITTHKITTVSCRPSTNQPASSHTVILMKRRENIVHLPLVDHMTTMWIYRLPSMPVITSSFYFFIIIKIIYCLSTFQQFNQLICWNIIINFYFHKIECNCIEYASVLDKHWGNYSRDHVILRC